MEDEELLSPVSSNLELTFELINEETLKKWESKLNDGNNYSKTVLESTNFDDYNLKCYFEKNIENDVIRTRNKERFNIDNFEEILTKLLAYYCKLNDMEYKQGLNEVLAPFILLSNKLSLKLSRVFNLFSLFIGKFLTNYFSDPELFAFRSSISLISLLLRYHQPQIAKLFEEVSITPQMYATNWLLTTYANKTSLELVYKFWDILIEENDPLFIHYMVIAFLTKNKDRFLNCDLSTIPILFSRLIISTKEDLSDIIKIAKQLRNDTPNSFKFLVDKLEIFKPKSHRLKEQFFNYCPERMLTLPILAEEIIEIYNNNNNLDFLILDLRINSESTTKEQIIAEGTLNTDKKLIFNNIIINQDLLKKIEIGNDLDKYLNSKISDYKNIKHIILLTNDTSYFNEYEEKYIKEKKENKNKDEQYLLNGFFSKIQTELNEKSVKLSTKIDKTNLMKILIKEYEIIKNFLNYLIDKEYKHISYAYGGFKNIHDICLINKTQLNNHDNEHCLFCLTNKENLLKKKYVSEGLYKENTEIKLVKKQSIDNTNIINDDFLIPIESIPVLEMNKILTDKNNKIFHCLLVWHNMNKYNEKIIFIIFNDIIKLYKMNIKNGEVFFDVLENINFESIFELKRDKNIFNLFYNYNDKNHDLKIDIFTDADGDLFNDEINHILNNKILP